MKIPPEVMPWLARGESARVTPFGGALGVLTFSVDGASALPAAFEVRAPEAFDVAIVRLLFSPLDARPLVAEWLALSALAVDISSSRALIPLAGAREVRASPCRPWSVRFPNPLRLQRSSRSCLLGVVVGGVPPRATAPDIGPARVAVSWEGAAIEVVKL